MNGDVQGFNSEHAQPAVRGADPHYILKNIPIIHPMVNRNFDPKMEVPYKDIESHISGANHLT